MFWVISLTLAAITVGVSGSCLLNETETETEICSSYVICEEIIDNFFYEARDNWNCIKHETKTYNDYNYEEANVYYDENFNLYVHLTNVDIYVSEDPLYGLLEIRDNVKKLNIKNGNLVSLPYDTINNLGNLIELSISHNMIETVNLRQFAVLNSLQVVNVSYNYVSTIEVGSDNTDVSSAINSIDLSNNALETIPDNCFSTFSNLIYLNLSSNKLSKLDILTFEGLTQLVILQLSNNRISEVGQSLARFSKLKTLSLNNNQLTSLTDLNFRTLSNLEDLNLSSNLIKHIEDTSFATLNKLQKLDLSHNKICVIHKTLFINNINMYKLSLSYNSIENVESGAFKANNLSYFNIKNNDISGSIQYNILEGIFVESLDFSSSKLTHIGDRAFSVMGSRLNNLNLSDNLIGNITKYAFQSLTDLSKLDLSCNNLTDIDFETNDLTNLTEYKLQNNKIKKITSSMFRDMINLRKLDLSKNNIEYIELNSFIKMKSLNTLNMSCNNFENSLLPNIFRGLHSLKLLDLSNTRLSYYFNETFSGLVSLTRLNSSHSQLGIIEYETFKGTGDIITIDLSYNVLQNFYVNTSSIPKLTELYLNHNRLKNVTSETFKNLRVLEKLYLSNNNILLIDPNALQTLPWLRYLDLISNLNLRINGNMFNNLTLSQVSLNNIIENINFKNAMNTSIHSLILSHCDIEDINLVFVYKIKYILKLDVSLNKIKTIDKGSFQEMPTLNWLDLSQNMISTIQPGSFVNTNMINHLNLFGNILQSIQFGVLDGLNDLRTLNLSSNALHTFSANLLHTTPYLTHLFLENNNLVNIDFKEFSGTNVETLSIGGNGISCDTLINLKKLELEHLNVTAESLDFNSENYYGIKCKTIYSHITQHETDNTDITRELIELKEAVGKLNDNLKTSLDDNFSKMFTFLQKHPDYLDQILESFNNSQVVFVQHLQNLFQENKNTMQQLVDTSNNKENDFKMLISLMETNNNLTKLGNTNKEIKGEPVLHNSIEQTDNLTLRIQSNSEFKKYYDNEPRKVKLDVSEFVDIKVLLYFIAISLAIIILIAVLKLLHKYLNRSSISGTRIMRSYDNVQMQ